MYVFAVQEMNVPMSQVHWMTRNVASSGAAGALNPTGFPSRAPPASQSQPKGAPPTRVSSGAYKNTKPINRLFPFHRPIWFSPNFSPPATNKFTATWMWNQRDDCRPNRFGRLPGAGESWSARTLLTNWFDVRYGEEQKRSIFVMYCTWYVLYL